MHQKYSKNYFHIGNIAVKISCAGPATTVREGVALVKPTTSYFWFLVTFCHNQICGLAVAFKNCILGCLPALLKIIPKTGDVVSCAQMPIM